MMVANISDIEIENHWNAMELEDKVNLLRRIGYADPTSGKAVYLNWIALQERTRAKLRKINGDPMFNSHAKLPEVVVEEPKRRRNAGYAKWLTSRIKNKNICQRCEIKFGADGEDTLECGTTRVCTRCMQDQMANKVRSDRAGEEVFAKKSVPEFYWTNEGEWKPRKVKGERRRAK